MLWPGTRGFGCIDFVSDMGGRLFFCQSGLEYSTPKFLVLHSLWRLSLSHVHLPFIQFFKKESAGLYTALIDTPHPGVGST